MRSGTAHQADTLGEDRARLAKELARLDPYSFWVLPAGGADTADLIVTGTTGVFLLRVCDLEGVLHLGRRPVVGEHAIHVRSLRASAKKLSARLVETSVIAGIEPVIVLTRALAGPATTAGGVRFLRSVNLVNDLTHRPRALSSERARQTARVLGMELAGDSARHFAVRT